MIKAFKDTIVTYVCDSCSHQWETINPKSEGGVKSCPECGVKDTVNIENSPSSAFVADNYFTALNTMMETFTKNHGNIKF